MRDRKRVHFVIKALVAFHVIAITVWSLPTPAPGVLNGTIEPRGTQYLLYYNFKFGKEHPSSPFRNYLMYTGTWQYWDMFAPDPSQMDLWGDCLVTFKDGTTQRYQYPRMYIMSLPTKYLHERYRKFFERAGENGYEYMWPTFAQRIALKNTTSLSNPPVKVELYRHTLKIPPFGNPIPENYTENKYYEHTVDQAKLATDYGGKP